MTVALRHPIRRTVRSTLAAAAVLSLATIGLVSVAPTARAAAPTGDGPLRWDLSSYGSIVENWGVEPRGNFGENLGLVGDYGSQWDGSMSEQSWASTYNGQASPLNGANLQASSSYGQSYGSTSAPAGQSWDGSILVGPSTGEATTAPSYGCPRVGVPLASSRITIQDVTVRSHIPFAAPNTFKVVQLVGSATSSSVTRLLYADRTNKDMRKLEVTQVGPTGTFRLFDDTVTVDVLTPARVVLTVDGNPRRHHPGLHRGGLATHRPRRHLGDHRFGQPVVTLLHQPCLGTRRRPQRGHSDGADLRGPYLRRQQP